MPLIIELSMLTSVVMGAAAAADGDRHTRLLYRRARLQLSPHGAARAVGCTLKAL
jgi:hypothetical protein